MRFSHEPRCIVMIARQWILPLSAAVALTLFGLPGLFAQPSAPPPVAKRPPNQLTMDEVNALMTRLRECWAPPIAVVKAPDVIVRLHIRFKPDGSLADAPAIANYSQAPLFQAAAESAVRAVSRCAPFSFLPAAKYAAWREVEVVFDPHTLPPSDKPK